MKNLLILGSGRSGTSMLTGSLANTGYNLGDNSNYLGKNKANPKGFFEDYEVNTINEDILKATIPIQFSEKIRKNIFPSFTFYRARWLAILPTFLKPKSTASINKRIIDVIKTEPFCFKDPRFSYTLPIWQHFFNDNTKFIVIFREPFKTAVSIDRECKESVALNTLKMNPKRALKVWNAMYNYILKIYNKSTEKDKWLFVHFDQMFDIEKIREIERFIDAKIDVSFPEKTISRTNKTDLKISPKTEKIYNQLLKLAY
ncbi:hypothetical protein ACFQZW_08455 [Lutibacter aestuarii]|uniref:Sulfotransferase family protein n=1 Tax=Lutibacter aestuarii TaxID=861111 RepID=A0ABW2Z5L9_9FLAO